MVGGGSPASREGGADRAWSSCPRSLVPAGSVGEMRDYCGKVVLPLPPPHTPRPALGWGGGFRHPLPSLPWAFPGAPGLSNTPQWLFSSLLYFLLFSLFWAGPCMFQGCQQTAGEAEFLLEKKNVYGKIMEAQPSSHPPNTHTFQVLCPPGELFQPPALPLLLWSLCFLKSHLQCQEASGLRAVGGVGVFGGPAHDRNGVP